MNEKLSRREFIKLQARSSLSLASATSGLFWPGTGFASATPDIGVARGQAGAATRGAVGLIGGMKRFVKKGQRVLIKPNMSFARSPAQGLFPERRWVVSTGLIGLGTDMMSLTGLNAQYGKPGEGQVGAPGLIRPPGALPETELLSRCVRCGECMVACPTNTLQPIWLKAGFPALFSPAVTPRRGFCDPQCHECATVCPTDAIRPMGKRDRTWAKIGSSGPLSRNGWRPCPRI